MPLFRYVGSAPRVYPALSLEVDPGDVVQLKRNPDAARFEPAKEAKQPRKPRAAKEAKQPTEPEVTE